MELRCKISEALLRQLGLDSAEEEIWYAAPYDIGRDGAYTRDGLVIAGPKDLWITEGRTIRHHIPIRQIEKLRCEPTVSGGCLTVLRKGQTAGQEQMLCRFTRQKLTRLSFVARGVQLLADGVEQKVISREPEKTCPRCGRALRGSRVCMHCEGKSGSWRRLMDLARGYRKSFWAISLIMLAGASAQIVMPAIQQYFIDNGLSDGSGTVREAVIFCLILLTIGVFSIVMDVARYYSCVKLGAQVSLDLRQRLYQKIQQLPISFVQERQPGELMNRMTQDTVRVRNFIQNVFGSMVLYLVKMAVALIMMLSINWKMALMTLIFVPIVLWIIKLMDQQMHRRFGAQYDKFDRMSTALQDIVAGIRVVKSFGTEKREAANFDAENHIYARVQLRNENFFSLVFPALMFVMGMGLYVATYFGGREVLVAGMTLGTFQEFILYAGMLYGPLDWISNLPRSLQQMFTSMERIYDVLEEPLTMEEDEGAEEWPIAGDVEFRDVTFGYRSYEPVLEKVNLKVKQGEMIGLVGASGTGKSTLINLLMRLYDPDDGKILIDGRDIRTARMSSYHAQLGVVLQETFLFSGTILENVRFSKPDASYEEVIRACKMANAHDFIVQTPDGYNTYVGERGYGLSGGERQRIAIARAILNEPRLLILDEATASLDTESEYLIQKAMDRLRAGRTTFAIAHRLSTLKDADRLVVIDGHRIAEVGTHNELLEKKGLYYKLVMAQLDMQSSKKEQDAE